MRRRALLGITMMEVGSATRSFAATWDGVTGDVGYGVPPLDAQQGEAMLLRQLPGGAVLSRMEWNETEGDRPYPARNTAIDLAEVVVAADPMVPQRDGPFWGDPARWLLWREGATIRALGTALQQQSLTLPAPPAALLRPALQRTGGPVDLFVLAAGGRQVLRLRFARNAEATARVVQDIALPHRAQAGCAAFLPGKDLAIGLIAPGDNGITLLVNDGTRLRQIELPGVRPLSAPVLVAGQRQLRLGLLVLMPAGVGLAEAMFPGDSNAAPQITLRPLGVTEALLHASMIYDRAGVMHAALAVTDGSYLHVDHNGARTPLSLPSPPVHPLVLAPRQRGAMLLCCDRNDGPLMADI